MRKFKYGYQPVNNGKKPGPVPTSRGGSVTEPELVFIDKLPESNEDVFSQWMANVVRQYLEHPNQWAEQPILPAIANTLTRETREPFVRYLFDSGLTRKEHSNKEYWSYQVPVKRPKWLRR